MTITLARVRRVAAPALAAATVFVAFAAVTPPRPGEAQESVAARAGARPSVRYQRASDLMLAAAATARAWSPEASLVYIENADSLALDGSAKRWTFIYASPERAETRAFTLGEGGATSVPLPFVFEPTPVEDGWIEPSALLPGFAWNDDDTRSAVAGARVAVLSRGLLPGRVGATTTWYVGQVRGAGAVFEALRGMTLSTKGPGLAGEVGALGAPGTPGNEEGQPIFLRTHRAAFLARLEREHTNDGHGRRDRAKALAAREADILARLGATQAAIDSLGRGEVEAAGRDVETALARLTAWRADEAKSESLLARSDARLTAAERDLAAGRPTELALYLSIERRARPASLRVFVDNAEVARRAYGNAEWNALDAGAWSEIVRASIRPGSRTVRVQVEDADRRAAEATWTGTLPQGALSLLRLELRGSGEGPAAPPRLDRIAGTNP